jgi:NAD(P)-dependent dehydrogenase (short-subunit alcohol dehydrogenase family)
MHRTIQSSGSDHALFYPGLFSNKRVLITGAGRGIGAAIAQYLVDDGAQVVAHLGRDAGNPNWVFPNADQRCKHIDLFAQNQQSAADINCYVCAADLTEENAATRLVEQAGSILGAFDILINNAGTMLGRVATADMTAEHYHRVTDLNARSVVLLTTAALPFLQDAEAASIVNVTSISADTGGSAGSSIYSAAKGFVSTYTRSLATELAADGIRVNAISPGTIDTDFHQRYSSPEKLQATADKTPLRRLGTVDDCVPACLFLSAKELSGFITGQIIGINGGTAF